MPQIANITISTKKNETQHLRFLVQKCTPYPDTEGYGGQIRWRNTEGLLKSPGREAKGLEESYTCYLLPPETIPPTDFNRTHFAGYNGNPNTLSIRGRDLLEVTVTLTPSYAYAKVRGFETPTPLEEKVFSDSIYPQLREFVLEKKEELHKEAIQRVEDAFTTKLAQLEDSLENLRKESQKAIGLLKSQLSKNSHEN